MEHYFQDAFANHGMGNPRDGSFTQKKMSQKLKSVSADAASSENNSNGCFDCNICLENVRDPVVTLCRHLYCWQCIYKWIHFRSTSTDAAQQPQCPICKANVSKSTLVPLYGRDHSTPEIEPKEQGLEIPCRPPACGVHSLIAARPSQQLQSPDLHEQNYHHHDYRPQGVGMGGTMMTHPIVRMFGEIVCATVLGSSAKESFYGHPSSYQVLGSSSPRVRR
ncbi:hypothetical protein GIB67_035041 [Kingdonia uniflora]|uniref:E3 ubiquitin-protein ligase RMA n=1 Tax=Kingdonia uniflora TaxID=39325 RepID=A0A7J7L1N9_9MAGN|nr:hypothetical protein GIB67_035041 [Kingdonia uniflora]